MEGLANDLMVRREQILFMVAKTDKDHSLLTRRQREILITNPDPSDSLRTERGRMRNRVRVGLGDFTTLNQNIRPRDLERIFDKRLDETTGKDEHLKYGDLPELGEPDFDDTAMAYILTTHMVAFAYRGLRAIGNDPDSILSNAIMRGVEMGEAKHCGVDRSLVEWDFDLEVHDSAELDPLEKWKRDLPMSADERAQLHEELIEVVPEEVYQETTPMDFDDLVSEYLVSED